MQSRTAAIKESISELLELPKDIVLDLPRITLIGNLQIYIENHKGIVEYSKTRIRIKTKSGILRITGKELMIKNIAAEEIVVCGSFESIEFMM
ncbi:sporulation protein YqfC [Geosporobacter subterraneus DSM 17957]|uniref:Sporulation protein YqfC n=1 Tax=Geosporobacter subterraneus DSM 17957 TaxID=1121919 RepID=A0A1M6JIT7_9FIRM|nr:sporulation protein YqfC [Geosporobacter subterraneus]SHJ46593.1 sporulation protein YqfC [Geosporobacter subterraneus DSM 17957]